MFDLTLRATIDFETRSECDLQEAGSWRYSLDPTTEILCLVWRLPYWEAGRTALWHPAFPHLGIPDAFEDPQTIEDAEELCFWIENGGLCEAHNAWFERGIWTNILAPKYGFPLIPHRQWRCSAAKGASHALPRALGDVADALMLRVRKDDEGHTLMLKVCKPRKALKADKQAWLRQHNAGKCPVCKGKGTYKRKPCEECEGQGVFPTPIADVPPLPTLWHESADIFARVWAYCRMDVLAEECVSSALPDLNEQETELYLLDQAINERGFQLDEDAVSAALHIIDIEATRLNDELNIITLGAVERGTQRARLTNWLASKGLVLENTQAKTIADVLENDAEFLDPDALMALEILQDIGRSSTGKYERMRTWKCPDGRVRGGLLYHGAATGRWSGSGVQPHNFVRGTIKISQDRLWDCLKRADLDEIRALTDDKTGQPIGSVMVALANALRGAICAAEGAQLYVADYAAIEARVLLWLADDDHIELFRRGEDIYCDMATTIYERTITKKDTTERQLGKATILGCGYQMGWAKFVAAAAAYNVTITEEFSQRVVAAYRSTYTRVVELWYEQEAAAVEAVRTGEPVTCGRITWSVEQPFGRFLYAELPSGRRLAYAFPQVASTMVHGRWRQQLTFMSVDAKTHQWTRQKTYGGMIVENLVQAISRDIMADAMLRCEESGIYRPVLSVHDELIAEADMGTGDVKDYERLLATPPSWAEGCPIAAEGWVGTRYRK
jgi:DNA polymerase